MMMEHFEWQYTLNPHALNSTQMSRNGEKICSKQKQEKIIKLHLAAKDDEEMKRSTDRPTNEPTNKT